MDGLGDLISLREMGLILGLFMSAPSLLVRRDIFHLGRVSLDGGDHVASTCSMMFFSCQNIWFSIVRFGFQTGT